MALPGLVAANNLSDVADRERTWDNLGSSLATGDIAIPAPSLDLNFAANKSLVDDISGNNLITFSRASSGTFIGSNGLIQTAASGVPRFDHNPVTGESLGLLVEEARTNLVLRSDAFSDAYWLKTAFGTGVVPVVTPEQAVAPDNTLTGDQIDFSRSTTANGNISYIQSANLSPTATSYAGSVWVKAATSGDVGKSIQFRHVSSSGAPLIHTLTLGWQRISTVETGLAGTRRLEFGLITSAISDTSVSVHAWGAQLEVGSFPTSYIPTVASTVTRAADVAAILGANFSSWYNQSEGTLFVSLRTNTPTNVNNGLIQMTDGTNNNRIEVQQVSSGDAFPRVSGLFRTSNVTTAAWTSQESGWIPNGQIVDKWALGFNSSGFSFRTTYDSTPPSGTGSYPQNLTTFFILHRGTISRIAYWSSRLNERALAYIVQPLISSINIYSFSFAVKGRDVLALEDARNTSTRDFIFIKGLLSAAQPRLTAAAASTASGLALASNALLKLAPTSSGNYFFASGLTLSGVTTRINGTNALSIATSPFSGSTATAPLLFRELRPQANWRIMEPMPSGTIASPELAIPFETNDFVLFMKAGQN